MYIYGLSPYHHHNNVQGEADSALDSLNTSCLHGNTKYYNFDEDLCALWLLLTNIAEETHFYFLNQQKQEQVILPGHLQK